MARACLALMLTLACASVPEPPAPGTSQAFGDLRLVPRDGVRTGGSGSYGDRRLRDVEFVDYTRPGFAVVYVQQETAPAGRLAFEIRESRIGTEIHPSEGAVGAAGRVSVRNATAVAHVFSYPAAGLVKKLAPGETAALDVPRAGEQGLYLLDDPAVAATLFAAPGPFTVVSATGRFTLTDLEPGRAKVRAWHPRFPPAAHEVELPPDAQVRVDFEIGVGRGGGSPHVHPASDAPPASPGSEPPHAHPGHGEPHAHP